MRHRRCSAAMLALLLVVAAPASSAGPAFRLAQTETSAPPPDDRESRPAATESSRPAPGGTPPRPPAATCFDVTVTVDERKRNGSVWDLGGAGARQPDPRISESSTGASTRCKDTHVCTLRVPGRGPFSFVITDMDLSNHDPIGQGTCRADGPCRLGSASLSIRTCR